MVSAVVLAAGAGSRIGTTKALVALEGVPLLEHVVRTCAASLVDEIVVVTGCDAEAVERSCDALRDLPTPVRCARNDAWRLGRTGSIHAGWRACSAASHVLVFPVDHPCVEPVTLDLLVGAFGFAAGAPDVVAPVHGQAEPRRRGHPVLLARRIEPDVLALGADDPLSSLVRRRQVLDVPVDDEGVLLDVDAPEDLARASRLLERRRRRTSG
jgi:CTP:molybdopterin cytidylyltransferase MocA